MPTHPAMARLGLARTLAAAAVCMAASGCCTMARLFCGPDRSHWVSESYDTPARTLATFQESLRRADPQTLIRCLSESLKAREGGLGSLSIEVLWSRLSKQTGGLHLLGTADVDGPQRLVDGRIDYVLRVSGHALRVTLVRQPYWEIRWAEPGNPDEVSEDGLFEAPHAALIPEPDGVRTRVEMQLPAVVGPASIDQLIFAGIGATWKVDAIEPLEAGSTASANQPGC